MSGCKPLLSLCQIPKVAGRDGVSGANAKVYLPFYGWFFFSGAQYAFPNAQVPQYAKNTLTGQVMPDTFQKDCCSCIGTCPEPGPVLQLAAL